MGKVADRHKKRIEVLRKHLEEAECISAENVAVVRPLTEWKELWLNDLRIGNRSPRTIEVYEAD